MEFRCYVENWISTTFHNWEELYDQMLHVFKKQDEAGFGMLSRYLDEDEYQRMQ